MKLPALFLFSVATTGFLAGCASKPFLSAPTVPANEMNVPRAGGMTIAQAQILGRKLKPGMTGAEITAILGEPDDKSDRTQQGTPGLRWLYRWKVFIGYRLEIGFERRGEQWLMVRADWFSG